MLAHRHPGVFERSSVLHEHRPYTTKLNNDPMEAWTQGVKARLINIHWYAILSRGSVIAQMCWRVYFARVGFGAEEIGALNGSSHFHRYVV